MEVDVLIVGAGTAGIPAALKLAEKGEKVLVLEAGVNEDANPLISDPLAAGSLLTAHTNPFFAPLGHAEQNAFPDNKRFAIVEAMLDGGGSSVNGMQWVRGPKAYFRRLEAYLQDPAWGPKNVFRVYRQEEKFNGVPGEFSPKDHGFKGPFDVRQAVANLPAASQFVAAVVAQGYPLTPDYNSRNRAIGAFRYWQLSQKPNKKRESTSTAYLHGFEKIKGGLRSKCGRVTILHEAHVLKFEFEDRACDGDKKARLARAVIKNEEVEIRARRFISSAGLVSSQLLELSGIGDPELLAKEKIPLVVANPNVGRNLLNHPILALSGLGAVAGSTTDPQALYSGGAELPDPSRGDAEARAFQLIGIAGTGVFTIAGLLLDAQSRGEIHAQHGDALRPPIANFRYFSDPADVVSLVALYGILYRTLLQMGLTPITPTGGVPPPPANSLNPADASFQLVATYALSNYSQAYHWSGSCRMAPNKAEGVVDHNGRVFGTSNLYVADLTILPFSPLGNGMAPALLIGNIIAEKQS